MKIIIVALLFLGLCSTSFALTQQQQQFNKKIHKMTKYNVRVIKTIIKNLEGARDIFVVPKKSLEKQVCFYLGKSYQKFIEIKYLFNKKKTPYRFNFNEHKDAYWKAEALYLDTKNFFIYNNNNFCFRNEDNTNRQTNRIITNMYELSERLTSLAHDHYPIR